MPTAADDLTLEDWVAREAISFSPDDGPSLNAAVDRLMSACDPALEILGLGEPTHLVDDYLRLRNRLFQSLVERHGFTAIAIESSFTRGGVADDYVAGRDVSLDAAIDHGITHQMGRVPANGELLQWMRRHNADAAAAGRPEADRLRFYGFDSPTEMTYADSPRVLLAVALDYLATLNPTGGQARRARIEPLIGSDADWENPAAMMDPSKSVGRSPAADALRVATEDLIAELAALRPQGVAADAAAYRRAMRHAAHARQMLAYHAVAADSSPTRFADLLAHRDAMMADNLAYIAEQEQGRRLENGPMQSRSGGGRVFAFAHNSHLKRGQAGWQWGPTRIAWWPAGAHLAASMGSRYAVVGVGAGASAASRLAPPAAGTLEARLLAASGPARLVPTHLGRTLKAGDLPVRDVGGNPGYFPFDRESLTDFDFLALLDKAE